jgi:hypothetical protein
MVRDSRVSDSTKEDSVLILEYIKEVIRHVSACALEIVTRPVEVLEIKGERFCHR